MANKHVTRGKAKSDAEIDALFEGVMNCNPALFEGVMNCNPALFEGVMNCNPALLPSLLDEVADAVQDNEQVGIPWRLTAVLACKDGEFFKQVASDVDTAKTMASIIGGLDGFSKRLETMKQLTDTVRARLAVAGCNHEKFNDWVKEAA